MASIFADLEHGVEIVAEDALKFIGTATKKVGADGPAAIAGFAVLGAALDKAFSDVETGAANPTTLVLNFTTDVADIKAVWPAIKVFVETFGVKI